MRHIGVLLLLGLLAGCGSPDGIATPIPTLAPILSAGNGSLPLVPQTLPTPAVSSATERNLSRTPTPGGSPEDPLEQYRRWIDEARKAHPYAESADIMWDVMLCESSGNAVVEGPGGLVGLFQYTPQTWSGDWNPYRDEPITDAHAQIFATAKAWSDGNQQWWQVCLPS